MTTLTYLACSIMAAAWLAAGNASAKEFPSRPITVVVPFAAGGPADVQARIIAERMKVTLGQPVIIENVVGGAGSVAAGKVARSANDGYTVSYGYWGTHVLNGAIYPLSYDVVQDFEPISLLGNNPLLILGRSSLPAENLQQLVEWLEANPDKALQGTSGVGSASHVAAILFQHLTGTHFQFVPYRGAAPVMQDLIAGRLDVMFDQVSSALPHVRNGELKVYAVTAKKRLASAPEVPTVEEAGLPGLQISVWHALFAPKATPRPVIAKLNAAVVDALADPVVRERLESLGVQIPTREQQTPQALSDLQKAEIQKWWPILKAANVRAE
ncbi:tripartite tricarboxylate transporter substrate binding protein BugD [Bradyrhizobium diazoefficiens]|uniref:tripartite tricarboxylate transporter substrate-binding protein n=1 Tax=Bradyrhizobium diazoefficiens TaxID=1355477 RepID=UPI00190C40DD|nr:tripartite tricarboxylate transporter substrate-binding protein [Bradyrhizobium diazoefficiens]QQO16846.1 tripartite tricarboxylate transporter substrate binding protein BugD [Bradyrhizobium diazoefficiens]